MAKGLARRWLTFVEAFANIYANVGGRFFPILLASVPAGLLILLVSYGPRVWLNGLKGLTQPRADEPNVVVQTLLTALTAFIVISLTRFFLLGEAPLKSALRRP